MMGEASVVVEVGREDEFAEWEELTLPPFSFRFDSIFPADNPSTIVMTRDGLVLQVVLKKKKEKEKKNEKVMTMGDEEDRNVTRIEVGVSASSALVGTEKKGLKGRLIVAFERDDRLTSYVMPPFVARELHISRTDEADKSHAGRAGMLYRDLIPSRMGGRFIASQIDIPTAGKVNDYVHYHNVLFQCIYVYRGSVKVVYEDNGEPFWMNQGDCVLQPPKIRHRVLENTAGMKVIEVSGPAEHMTFKEHTITLPTASIHRDRIFKDQKFVFHNAAMKDWSSSATAVLPDAVFEHKNTGIDQATNGLASVLSLRLSSSSSSSSGLRVNMICPGLFSNGAIDLILAYVLEGRMDVNDSPMKEGDCFSLSCVNHSSRLEVSRLSDDVKLLYVIVWRRDSTSHL
jgi:quercetin dioxygenase-like cupin family protein